MTYRFTRRRKDKTFDFGPPERPLRPIDQELWDSLYICGLCGHIHDEHRRFMKHITGHHFISYRQYVVRTKHGNVWPKCSARGCKRLASAGLSIFVERPLRCRSCELARFGPKGTVMKASRAVNQWFLQRKVEASGTGLERYKKRLSVLSDVRADGLLTDDEVKFYRTYLKEQIARLKFRDARRAREQARRDASMAFLHPRRSKVRHEDDDHMSTTAVLGFNSDKELWDRVQAEADVSKKVKKRKKTKKNNDA